MLPTQILLFPLSNHSAFLIYVWDWSKKVVATLLLLFHQTLQFWLRELKLTSTKTENKTKAKIWKHNEKRG